MKIKIMKYNKGERADGGDGGHTGTEKRSTRRSEERSDGHTWTSGSDTHTEQHGTLAAGREGDQTQHLRQHPTRDRLPPFLCRTAAV